MSSSARAGSTPPATIHKTWLPLFVIALVLGVAFISIFLGLQRHPAPRGLPVAVVGTPLAQAARTGLGTAVNVTEVPSPEAGATLVRGGEAVGVVMATTPGQLRLEYAGSAGLSETAAVERLASGLAQASGTQLQVADILPLAQYDARGLAAFYVVFGVTLSSFILAQLLAGGAVFARVRHRFAVLAGFAVVVGLCAAVIAGPVYGCLPAPFALLAVSLVLLSVSVAFATTAMAVWLGPPGISLAVLLFTILGNATSGATIGYHLLPGWARVGSLGFPNGAATSLIQDFGYFDGSGAGSSILVLLVWLAASVGLIVLHQKRIGARSDRGRRKPAGARMASVP